MARPSRGQPIPQEDRAAYERWRARVLSWPAAVDGPGWLRVSDLPVESQERIIEDLLVKKALRNGPDHWSRSIVDLDD